MRASDLFRAAAVVPDDPGCGHVGVVFDEGSVVALGTLARLAGVSVPAVLRVLVWGVAGSAFGVGPLATVYDDGDEPIIDAQRLLGLFSVSLSDVMTGGVVLGSEGARDG